ncbi:MAG: L,D-transpeptidase family protein [Sulfurovum sp.]|nr:L,D-transpeptidase family protein [Sulfurovum sp.]
MRILSLLVFVLFFYTTLRAQPLSMENISLNIIKGLESRIKGQNKNIIKHIYATTGNKPLWIGKNQAKKASDLIQALNNPLFNYKNKSFDQSSISRLYYLLDNGEISRTKKASVYARLDLILTSSMVRLVRFIVQGDVDWSLVQAKMKALAQSDDIHATWEMSPKGFPSSSQLTSAIVQGNIYDYLYALLPMKQRYLPLVELLKNYRVMHTFPKIPYSNSILKVGNRAKRIIEIKKRLQISGDYPQTTSLDTSFNETLKRAILTYQKRYLLKVTGTIDKTVTYYLNQPVSKNIQAIITNLDKTKLYPSAFETEHIEVNIPDFYLRYFLNGQKLRKMGIVVGRIDRPTPIFSDTIEYMVLNPTWTIPNNLIKRDLIHVLRDNPNYLIENNIHAFRGKKEIQIRPEMLNPYEHNNKVVPYRFVQYPGETNALGRVKFMFPNKYAVYLHDTDNKSLHQRRYKVYSSGCVRVENPFDLVNILLRYTKHSYTQESIEQILASNQPRTLRLTRGIPVHMVYFTVYQEDGLAYFKNDIYLYDQMIEESTEGNRKQTFKIPEKRMVSIKKPRNTSLGN